MLLTCGDYQSRQFNLMTVGWGSLGVMWNKPFVQIVVRPTRHTYQYLEKYDNFTLSALPTKFQDVLTKMGSVTGKYFDKMNNSGLTPMPSKTVSSPSFAEAELTIECQKMYWGDFVPTQFLFKEIDSNYPQKDYHRIYFGQILTIMGSEKYRQN
jgi:flavin reductase (DIM6/NTAB) family NADH-FMN oxidoreductase RutF